MDQNNNHKEDLPIPRKPDCFPEWNQWVEWCWLADLTFVSKSNFCLDCTNEYRSRMVLEKKCHYPQTRFRMRGRDLIGWCDDETLRRKTLDFPAEIYGLGSRREPPLAFSPTREPAHPLEVEDGRDQGCNSQSDWLALESAWEAPEEDQALGQDPLDGLGDGG